MRYKTLIVAFMAAYSAICIGQSANNPRVFFQSQSYGNRWSALRDQSMEMSKDFEQDCPVVQISINQLAADYTVVLNHIEAGLLGRDNQIEIADKNGDLISTTGEGGSMRGGAKRACHIILGDWYAQMAKHSADGEGVPQDYVKAAYWYHKGADLGFARAEYSLGVLYENGLGLTQDYVQAVYWYRGAAAQDDVSAEYNLGLLLHTGKGTPLDNAEAYFWMSVVAASNKFVDEQERAAKCRDQYATLLSAEILAKTRKQVSKWLKDQPYREETYGDDVPPQPKAKY